MMEIHPKGRDDYREIVGRAIIAQQAVRQAGEIAQYGETRDEMRDLEHRIQAEQGGSGEVLEDDGSLPENGDDF